MTTNQLKGALHLAARIEMKNLIASSQGFSNRRLCARNAEVRQRAGNFKIEHQQLIDLPVPMVLGCLNQGLAGQLTHVVIVDAEKDRAWLRDLDRNDGDICFFVNGRQLGANAFVYLELDREIHFLVSQSLRVPQCRLGAIEVLYFDQIDLMARRCPANSLSDGFRKGIAVLRGISDAKTLLSDDIDVGMLPPAFGATQQSFLFQSPQKPENDCALKTGSLYNFAETQ